MALFALALAAQGCDASTPTRGSSATVSAATTTSVHAAPVAAASGLEADGTLHVGPEDRCPVCAMRPAKNPRFAGAIELLDGRTFYTCGPGCLLRSHLHPEAYLGVGRAAVKRLVVQDYLNGRPTDAAKARWVAGSDVVGPMGPAIVPLANDTDETSFRERHGGKVTFGLAELDDAKWEALTGRKALPGPR
jgi:nitrous oxide reductase accessory protein NosL